MNNVNVPVVYYAQTADACVDLYDLSAREALKQRQFEWYRCDYYNLAGIEAGIVDYALDETGIPVAVGGTALTNRGVKGENFDRWWNEVEGKSTRHADNLVLNYDENGFYYENEDFHPVESELFTMEMAVKLVPVKDGRERFKIAADDDTWVYVDGRLVLDMGGVHEATEAEFTINEAGEISAATEYEDFVYSGVTVGETAEVKIFHANRNSGESVFKVRFENMRLNVVNSEGYVEPLGVSMVAEANREQLMTRATVMEVSIIAILVVAVLAIFGARKYLRKGSRGE